MPRACGLREIGGMQQSFCSSLHSKAPCRFVNKSKHIWGVKRQRKWGGALSSEIKIAKKEPAIIKVETRSRKTEEGSNKQEESSWCPGVTHHRGWKTFHI